MPLAPHQERVVIEKTELDNKLNALITFIKENPTFKTLDTDEQHRLKLQALIMTWLSEVLAERIEAFN